MRARMKLFWRRGNDSRERGEILTDGGGQGTAVSSEELVYHLKNQHAVPMPERSERAVVPAPESRTSQQQEPERLEDLGIGMLRARFREKHPGERLPKGRKNLIKALE